MEIVSTFRVIQHYAKIRLSSGDVIDINIDEQGYNELSNALSHEYGTAVREPDLEDRLGQLGILPEVEAAPEPMSSMPEDLRAKLSALGLFSGVGYEPNKDPGEVFLDPMTDDDVEQL